MDIKKVSYMAIPALAVRKEAHQMVVANIVEHTGVSRSQIVGRSRKGNIVFARQIVCYYLRKLGMSTVQTGFVIGKDHSSVSYAYKRISDLRETDRNTQHKLDEFERKYKHGIYKETAHNGND